MERSSVLIVERDMATREHLVQALQTRGFSAWGCPSPGTAMDLLSTIQPMMVMVDLDMEPEAGWELLRACKKYSNKTRVIMHSAMINADTIRRGKFEGADAVVSKMKTLKPLLGLTYIEPQMA